MNQDAQICHELVVHSPESCTKADASQDINVDTIELYTALNPKN